MEERIALVIIAVLIVAAPFILYFLARKKWRYRMIDKVQKIREEVERLKGWNNNVRNSTRHMTLQEEDFNRGKHSSYLEILDFIDSMQEEPVNNGLDLGCGVIWKDEEPVSEELEKVAIKYAEKKCYIDNAVYTDNEMREAKEKPRFHFYDIAAAFMEGSEWQKQQLMKDAVDSEACYTMGFRLLSLVYLTVLK